MKKMIFLFALVVGLTITATAQSPASFAVNSRAKGDTLTNADTLTKYVTATAGYNILALSIDVKKLTGTVAGSITVSGSSDGGTTYNTLSTDTLTNTAGTKGYFYNYSPVYYSKYKVVVITSGSVTAKLLPYYTLRGFKHD